MYTDLNKKELYENVEMKSTFIFFSPINIATIASKLSNNIRKKVFYTDKYLPESKRKNAAFLLSPSFSEGYRVYEFKTGYLPYHEALHINLKMMHLIEEYGFTNEKCSMSINIKKKEINENFNIFKMIMSIDEDVALKTWERLGEEKIYKNHIKYFYPRNPFDREINENLYINYSNKDMILPESDRFGLSFSRLHEGVIGVNYIGGKNYEKKPKEFVHFINEFIEKISECSNNIYNISQITRIKNLSVEQKAVLTKLRTYESFCRNYPDIKVYLDMKYVPDDLKTRFNLLRESLFKMIAYGGLTTGEVNYNSDNKMVQVRRARIRQGFLLEGIEFFDSFIMAELKNCALYNCEIYASTLKECKIFNHNDIRRSKIFECDFGGDYITIANSYIENGEKVINARITESMINGKLSHASEIDDKSIPVI